MEFSVPAPAWAVPAGFREGLQGHITSSSSSSCLLTPAACSWIFYTLLLGAEIISVWLWANQENQKLPSVPTLLQALCPSAFLPRPPRAQGDIAEKGLPLLMAELVPLSPFWRGWGHLPGIASQEKPGSSQKTGQALLTLLTSPGQFGCTASSWERCRETFGGRANQGIAGLCRWRGVQAGSRALALL